jgi:hypothetical protein
MVVYHSKTLVEQTVKILHLTAFGFRDRGGGVLTRRPLEQDAEKHGPVKARLCAVSARIPL